MVQRYIAIAWNNRIAERGTLVKALVSRLTSEIPDSQCVLASDGLKVFCFGKRNRSPQRYLLSRNAGVVLGQIFRKRTNGNQYAVDFKESEVREIQRTEGRYLTEHYWGSYVALLPEDGGGRTRVLRDPTGAIPCLLTRFRGIDIVCSHIESCTALGLVKGSINWDHVAAYLWFDNIVTNDTGLDDVRQIQAGECVTIGSDSTSASFYWNPACIERIRTIEDRDQAMRELKEVIQFCVGAWASCYSSVLHGLSGGLDSAVVLACLSKISCGVNVVCENHYTQSVQGDERAFAEKAARYAGVELIEIPMRASAEVLESMLCSKKVATPKQTRLVHEVHAILEKVVKARSVEAIFSGQGGDHFFQQTKTSLIAAEYAWRHGLGRGILNVIADTSRFTRKPIWSVMATAFTAGILQLREDPYRQLGPPLLLSDAARDTMSRSRIRHSWINEATHLPGSKLLQIFNIIDSQNFYQEPCDYADIVHPLISQPIIELCLQIPCYVLTYNGIDRALVRDAFSDVVPPEITRRTTKGATTSYVNGLLVRNLPFLREYLLAGVLVGEGVLDCNRTEVALTESHLLREPLLLFPVLNALRAEAWLRTWISDRQRAAA